METFIIIGGLVVYAIVAVIVMAFADEPLTALFWPFLFIFIMVESLWMLIQDGIRKLRSNTTDKENKK